MNGPVEARDRIVSAVVAVARPIRASAAGVVKFLGVSFDAPDVDSTAPDQRVALP